MRVVEEFPKKLLFDIGLQILKTYDGMKPAEFQKMLFAYWAGKNLGKPIYECCPRRIFIGTKLVAEATGLR